MPLVRPLMAVPHHRSGARELRVGAHVFYFSDDQCIGYKKHAAKTGVRITTYSQTETARRHMHELGIMNYEPVTPNELDKLLLVLDIQ